MRPDSDPDVRGMWKQDLARYGQRPHLRDLSIYAIAIYRFGAWNDRRTCGRVNRLIAELVYLLGHRMVELLLGITLPKEASFGGGLRIHHLGPIVVHPATVAGQNCTIRHGVTIGERRHRGGVPTIGDDVELGAYAQLLGDIKVGDGAKVGALCLVIQDIPDGRTVVAPTATIQ